MRHVFWLIEGQLAGRPGPSLAPWSLEELRAAGFDAILNVSELAVDEPDLARLGFSTCWVPLPAVEPPDGRDEIECLHALPLAHAFIRARLRAKEKVLVHCMGGKDRTGLVLAHHLAATEGLSPEEAIARVRRVRPIALSAYGWEEMALRVIAKLAPPGR